MKSIRQVHAETAAREARKGFRRSYPNHPMIDMGFLLKRREARVLKRLIGYQPFRRGPEERQRVSQWLVSELAKCYDMPAPSLRWEGDGMGDSGISSYNAHAHTITMRGHWSYITLLHEFAHSLGWGEQGAVWYSVNVFRRTYPTSFWALRNIPGTHYLMRANDAPANAVPLQRPTVN